jgi:hypothetical protein
MLRLGSCAQPTKPNVFSVIKPPLKQNATRLRLISVIMGRGKRGFFQPWIDINFRLTDLKSHLKSANKDLAKPDRV